MKQPHKISDNEIQVLGQDAPTLKHSHKPLGWLIASLTLLALIVAVVYLARTLTPNEITPTESVIVPVNNRPTPTSYDDPEPLTEPPRLTIASDTVNDVPLIIFTPYGLTPELSLARPVEADTTVYFVAQAADFGKDDYGIVGDYVQAGKQLARGVRKEGYCAIIGAELAIGMGTNTPLLAQAIETQGFFFRQYPLVSNGEAIENKPKGKAIRRALAVRDGNIAMIFSEERESFHDFAQALADAGFSDAIALVGSGTAYYRYKDENGKTVEGEDKEEAQGVNYLVWRE
jgi:hypothetical protein